MNPVIMKILKIAGTVLLLFFAFVGVYYSFIRWQYNSVKKEVEQRESVRVFDKDLKYNMPLGEPIVWVKPGNKVTLFFVDGFRGQIGAGHYRAWFEKLHNQYGVNIVAPITALQGWPFAYRTREWHREEDMRQALQIYDAYCANLPAGHKIVVGSMSFGALSNITIGAKGKRKPDAMVMVAPLNTGLDYKSGSPIIRWLSSKIAVIQYIKPWMIRGKNKTRATLYDVVNDEMNLAAWNSVMKDSVNYEENLPQGVHLNDTAIYMENDLVPQVNGEHITILYGEDDLTFSAQGFESLGEKLRKAGNTVKTFPFAKSGHMLLYDNGGEQAKKVIEGILLGK